MPPRTCADPHATEGTDEAARLKMLSRSVPSFHATDATTPVFPLLPRPLQLLAPPSSSGHTTTSLRPIPRPPSRAYAPLLPGIAGTAAELGLHLELASTSQPDTEKHRLLEERLLAKQQRLEEEKDRLQKEKVRLQEKEDRLQKEKETTESKWLEALDRGQQDQAEYWRQQALSLTTCSNELEGQVNQVAGQAEEIAKHITILTKSSSVIAQLDAQCEKDRTAEKLATELLTIEPEELSDNVEWTRLTASIQMSAQQSPSLITRLHTRLLCDAVIDFLEKSPPHSRAVITGAPGIGKTRTLVNVLQLLLKKGKEVTYADRTTSSFTRFEIGMNGLYTAVSTFSSYESVRHSIGQRGSSSERSTQMRRRCCSGTKWSEGRRDIFSTGRVLSIACLRSRQ